MPYYNYIKWKNFYLLPHKKLHLGYVLAAIILLVGISLTDGKLNSVCLLIIVSRQIDATHKPGCLQLLEILEISRNFVVAPGKIYNSDLYFTVCLLILCLIRVYYDKMPYVRLARFYVYK